MKKVFLILVVLLFVIAAFLLSSGLPWRNSTSTPEPAVVSPEVDLAPTEQPVSTPEPTLPPTPAVTGTPVEEIPEIQVSDEFVIVLEENQGSDGL